MMTPECQRCRQGNKSNYGKGETFAISITQARISPEANIDGLHFELFGNPLHRSFDILPTIEGRDAEVTFTSGPKT